jgi:hypothetical protein
MTQRATPTSWAIKNPKTRCNWLGSDFLRRTLVFGLELCAKITGRKYYCATLVGETEHSITVNSDLTVSCTCQDYDGSGHLGLMNQIGVKICKGRGVILRPNPATK